MSVTDDQVAALRAYLALRPEEAQQRHEHLVRAGDTAHYGLFIWAAFVLASCRRFSPTWTTPEIVQYVASARARLGQEDGDIDPSAAELLVRRALGDPIAVDVDELTRGRVQIFLLVDLVADEQLDDAGLDAFMAEARAYADEALA